MLVDGLAWLIRCGGKMYTSFNNIVSLTGEYLQTFTISGAPLTAITNNK